MLSVLFPVPRGEEVISEHPGWESVDQSPYPILHLSERISWNTPPLPNMYSQTVHQFVLPLAGVPSTAGPSFLYTNLAEHTQVGSSQIFHGLGLLLFDLIFVPSPLYF